MKPNSKQFEDKIRAMKGSEIIMAMVEGLQKPKTVIDMTTYGKAVESDSKEFICFGCAATNTILSLCNIRKPENYLLDTTEFNNGFKDYTKFLKQFEIGVNYIRTGHIDIYNNIAEYLSIAKTRWYDELPSLKTYNYKENLHHYIKLAEYNKQLNN